MDDLHQTTGRDLNLVVGQKRNAKVGGDLQEQIQDLRKSLIGIRRLKSSSGQSRLMCSKCCAICWTWSSR